MRGIVAYFVRHPTAGNLLMLLMLMAGVYGGLNIRTQFTPDTSVNMVSLWFEWPGAGPSEIDRQILDVVEQPLLALDGVTQSAASAQDGSAWLNLFFEPGWDMARAVDDVRTRVGQTRNLPEAVEPPRISQVIRRDRVADIVLWGDLPVEQLTRYAADLQARLFAAGVPQASLLGAPDPAIRVEIAEIALIRHDLMLEDIARTVRAAVNTLPAGALGEGGARVRTGTERRSVEAVGDIVLQRSVDGSALRLRDVARVDIRTRHDWTAYFVEGVPAIRLQVERLAGGDALAILSAVNEVVDGFRPTLPDGVAVSVTRDRAGMIADRLGILVENGVLGLVLVLVLLFLFLSARTALWVAAGIPAAMAASLGLMYAAGLSLDMMSLFALIICLGVVVDDAIVVGEHADMLARRGAHPLEAAESAAIRMLPPVLAASATTVLAFLALTTIGGRFGAFIMVIPLTVTMVLVASIIESFLILPAHMRHALTVRRSARWYDVPARWMDRQVGAVRDGAFRPLTRAVVHARYAVLAGALALLFHAAAMVTGGAVPWRFFSAPERGVLYASFSMLPGATREDARAMLDEMTRALEETDAAFADQYGTAPVVFALGTVGGTLGRRLSREETSPGAVQGGMSVELIDPDRRPYPQGAFMARWNEAVQQHPGVETLAMRGARSGPGGDAISVAFTGADARQLKAASEALKAALAPYAAVAGLADNQPYDREELTLQLTPRGEALGLTVASVGRQLRARLSGIEAAEFPFGARSAVIEITLDDAALKADFLSRAQVRTPDGLWVALDEVSTVERRYGFAAIRRENGRPVLTVTGDFTTEDARVQADIRRLLTEDILPEIAGRFDVGWELTGLAAQERAFLTDARLGFLLCLAAIYLVLAWIFASWSRPLVVVLAIPLGFVGVVWGHHWMATPLSMFSVVGMIGMAGIVINDSIVLVTTVDAYARHRAVLPAIVAAAGDRLRAVFLTTATTVAGLAPLMFERSTQAQFLKPTAITLVFGLGFGMVLVLLVTPALLAVFHDIARASTSARRLTRHVLLLRRS